ncbi:DUF4386 domain-containing protein [Frankia sp. R82]|uniref:DUF4386 domain-containing protein n=1 Tax=Frankia sp. R82 TaxID=2950553 RepID=UPI002044142F|nr:DUF4386 domain-containing protein [Frankia sp. R82]MCM3885681.1 DUF4386 domain-containing protein [Frankia sp. R82]
MFIGRRTTAALLLVSAVCGAGGLTALRRAAGYPEVLTVSGTATLAAVQGHWFAVVTGLVLSVVAAGLLVPITVGLVRLLPGCSHRPLPIVLATAASAAQLVGLLFWLFIVPALFRRSAPPALSDQAAVVFDTARMLFAVMVGEVVACLLTACWSVSLVAQMIRSNLLGRLPAGARRPRLALAGLGLWGGVASAGVLGGMLLPLGVHPAVTGRVVGQLLWSLWLVGLAVAVWQLESPRPDPDAPAAIPPAVPSPDVPAMVTPWPEPAARFDPVPRSASSSSESLPPLADAFFDAITWIEPAQPDISMRAAPQPAGRALGNDDLTEFALLTPPEAVPGETTAPASTPCPGAPAETSPPEQRTEDHHGDQPIANSEDGDNGGDGSAPTV